MDREAAMTEAHVTTNPADTAGDEDYPRLQQEYGQDHERAKSCETSGTLTIKGFCSIVSWSNRNSFA